MALPSQQESGYKWVVLAVGMFAQASTSTFFQGLASVGPVLRHEEGLSLAGLGIVLGAPPAGFVLTLLAWGWASDRFNERHVMVVGLIGAAAGLFACGQVSGLWPVTLCLGFAGAAGASVNAASGRAVLLWFVAERRGLAMGLRQTAVPLGACVAAILLPGLVSRLGMGAGFRGLAAFCLLGALASFLWIREPPHRPAAVVSAVLPEGAEDTQPRLLYNRQLWKLVGASSSLVVCQFTFVAFLVEMLHGRRGISLALAGLVFASAQICGGGRTHHRGGLVGPVSRKDTAAAIHRIRHGGRRSPSRCGNRRSVVVVGTSGRSRRHIVYLLERAGFHGRRRDGGRQPSGRCSRSPEHREFSIYVCDVGRGWTSHLARRIPGRVRANRCPRPRGGPSAHATREQSISFARDE